MNIYNQIHDLESVLQESDRILQRKQESRVQHPFGKEVVMA